MLRTLLIKSSYASAFWTTVFGALAFPFAMVTLDAVTGAGRFSIEALVQVAKTDLPFFAAFFAVFNFFGAWRGKRLQKTGVDQ